MFGIHDFSLFLAAGILLNLTPGSDTVYILGRSVAQGRGAGVASALGICVGSIFTPARRRLGFRQFWLHRHLPSALSDCWAARIWFFSESKSCSIAASV